jgi:hypothetical protein
MASGHVNRTYRPNTWQHRPSLRCEDSSCQPGAVQTWHIASVIAAHMSGVGSKPDSNTVGLDKVLLAKADVYTRLNSRAGAR